MKSPKIYRFTVVPAEVEVLGFFRNFKESIEWNRSSIFLKKNHQIDKCLTWKLDKKALIMDNLSIK